MRCSPLLAGDIGGTKTLLSLYQPLDHGLELLVSERYTSADWPDLAPMVRAFLAGPAAAIAAPEPQAACFAVAPSCTIDIRPGRCRGAEPSSPT